MPPPGPSEMVEVPLTNGTNGTNVLNGNGKRGTTQSQNGRTPPKNPYAPRASDFLSNISNFNIIESTLRGTYCNTFVIL